MADGSSGSASGSSTGEASGEKRRRRSTRCDADRAGGWALPAAAEASGGGLRAAVASCDAADDDM